MCFASCKSGSTYEVSTHTAIIEKSNSSSSDNLLSKLTMCDLTNSDSKMSSLISKVNAMDCGLYVEIDKKGITDEAYSSRVLADVLNGNGPDILFVSYEDMDNLYRNGAIRNLDEVVTEEDVSAMISGVAESGMIDGHRVGLVPYIASVRTFFGSLLYDYSNWNLDGIFELKENNSNIKRVLSYMNGPMDEYFELYSIISSDLTERYISNGKSHFSELGFADVLLFIKEDCDNVVGGVDSVSMGETLAYYFPIWGPANLFNKLDSIDGGGVVVGFPSQAGSNCLFSTDGYIVVNNRCKDDEAVALLVNKLLTLDVQLSNPNMLSVRRDAGDFAICDASEYNKDGSLKKNCCKWQSSNGTKTSISLALNENELKKIYYDYMSNIRVFSDDNAELMDIIWGEAESFFHDDKNVDEVVKNIDKVVQLYIDERK